MVTPRVLTLLTSSIPLPTGKIKHHFDCIWTMDGRSAVDLRLPEQPLVLPAERRGVLVVHPVAGTGGIQVLAEHEAPGLLSRPSPRVEQLFDLRRGEGRQSLLSPMALQFRPELGQLLDHSGEIPPGLLVQDHSCLREICYRLAA